MYLAIPVTNCTAEGGFSALKGVESEKRSTMGEGKLKSLMILCSACGSTLEMDFDHLIVKFAQFKKGKKPLL